MAELNRRRFLVTGASLPAAALPTVALSDLSMPNDRDLVKREIFERFIALGWAKDSMDPFTAWLAMWEDSSHFSPEVKESCMRMLDQGRPFSEINECVKRVWEDEVEGAS